MNGFSHLDDKGNAIMVDVSLKEPTVREAKASATINLDANTFSRLIAGDIPKGDAFAVARIAGIMAAKKVDMLIPLCHSIPVSSVEIEFLPDNDRNTIEIISNVKCFGVTGVEMEALASVSVAALALYDMCKAINKGITISSIRLLKKTGGKSGVWTFNDITEA
jgi:cyclic pyranopterin phosphate synthase